MSGQVEAALVGQIGVVNGMQHLTQRWAAAHAVLAVRAHLTRLQCGCGELDVPLMSLQHKPYIKPHQLAAVLPACMPGQVEAALVGQLGAVTGMQHVT
jgi:hypothetical protein